MSLTLDDLQQIKALLRSELAPIQGTLEAIENDVKELYFTVANITS